MEFWGFIYTKEDEIRDFFNPYGYRINNDYSINSDNIKKYKIDDKWIHYSNYNYLKKINLRKYIKRSRKFAKILYSSDQQILKFDYIENGKFKNQIVVAEGELKSIKGYADYFKHIPINDLFEKLIEHHFGLSSSFVIPESKYFINENKQDFQLKLTDYISWLFYLRGTIQIAFFLILFVLLVRVFIGALSNGTLKSAPTSVYLLFFSYLCFAIYLFWEILTEIKNYLSIKNKVLNDDIVALLNNTSYENTS